MATAICLIAGCSGSETTMDVAETADDVQPSTCRPVNEPWLAGSPLRLPCVRTEEACNGQDDDGDGITDPHCPTRSCASDADCTFGGVVVDTDCCVRECQDSSCGNPDGCGGSCPCDGSATGPVCTQIDGFPASSEPTKCWGVLCPPGLKCVVGQCVEPGTRLPGEVCNGGEECAISAGCVPFDPSQPPRCLQYCQVLDCPVGFLCAYQEYPTPSGGHVIHETCRHPGLCERARRGCAPQMSACLADPECAAVIECAAAACPDGGDGPDDGDESEGLEPCLRDCLAARPDTQSATNWLACLNSECTFP